MQLAQSYREFARDGLRVGDRLTEAVRDTAALIDLAEMIAPPDPAAARVAWVLSPRRVDDRIRRALEALAGGLDPELVGALLVRLSYAADAAAAP